MSDQTTALDVMAVNELQRERIGELENQVEEAYFILSIISRKFKSGNSVPVDRAQIDIDYINKWLSSVS